MAEVGHYGGIENQWKEKVRLLVCAENVNERCMNKVIGKLQL
jgi:hypothetical protein